MCINLPFGTCLESIKVGTNTFLLSALVANRLSFPPRYHNASFGRQFSRVVSRDF